MSFRTEKSTRCQPQYRDGGGSALLGPLSTFPSLGSTLPHIFYYRSRTIIFEKLSWFIISCLFSPQVAGYLDPATGSNAPKSLVEPSNLDLVWYVCSRCVQFSLWNLYLCHFFFHVFHPALHSSYMACCSFAPVPLIKLEKDSPQF